MATTPRGIYFTDETNDQDVADFNVITKRVADSVDVGLQMLDALSPVAGVEQVTTDALGDAAFLIPEPVTGTTWSVQVQAVGGLCELLEVRYFVGAPTTVICRIRAFGSPPAGATLTRAASIPVTLHWQAAPAW